MPTPPLAITGTVDGVADRPGELEVEAVPGAVAVHGGEQDLAGAEPPASAAHATASRPVGVRPPWT